MDYLYFDLKYLKQNDIVKAIIKGTECNVILLNSVNFSNYKSCKFIFKFQSST